MKEEQEEEEEGRREKEEGEEKGASSCFLTALGACIKKTALSKAGREPSQGTRATSNLIFSFPTSEL